MSKEHACELWPVRGARTGAASADRDGGAGTALFVISPSRTVFTRLCCPDMITLDSNA